MSLTYIALQIQIPLQCDTSFHEKASMCRRRGVKALFMGWIFVHSKHHTKSVLYPKSRLPDCPTDI